MIIHLLLKIYHHLTKHLEVVLIIKMMKEKVKAKSLPKSRLMEAVNYTLNQWDALVAYTTNGDCAIDNNTAERAVKPFAIGRKNWLFFGEQHAASDFYYQDEIQQFQKDGVLTELSLAFSRDQAQKIYVQDRMREQGEAIWNWLEEGAYFCVCGDASRMARDVEQALRDVAREHGGLSEEKAAEHIRRLAEQKRYLRDVY